MKLSAVVLLPLCVACLVAGSGRGRGNRNPQTGPHRVVGINLRQTADGTATSELKLTARVNQEYDRLRGTDPGKAEEYLRGQRNRSRRSDKPLEASYDPRSGILTTRSGKEEINVDIRNREIPEDVKEVLHQVAPNSKETDPQAAIRVHDWVRDVIDTQAESAGRSSSQQGRVPGSSSARRQPTGGASSSVPHHPLPSMQQLLSGQPGSNVPGLYPTQDQRRARSNTPSSSSGTAKGSSRGNGHQDKRPRRQDGHRRP